VSRFERERDRAPRRCPDRHLSEQSRIGGLPLEQPAKIEELHQAKSEAVLEGRVQREMHEQILVRGHPLHETGSPAAASPGGVEVERKEPGTGGNPAMKLDDRTRRWVEEGPRVVGLSLLGEASLLEQRDRPGPLVEHQQVNVRHGAMGHRVVEALGERGPLERETTHPSRPEEILDPARRIELAHPKSKVFLLGPAERHSRSIWPADLLFADCLMKKPGQTLLARHLDEQACQRPVGSRRQLTRDQPPT
jgi:hypothetical protein